MKKIVRLVSVNFNLVGTTDVIFVRRDGGNMNGVFNLTVSIRKIAMFLLFNFKFIFMSFTGVDAVSLELKNILGFLCFFVPR